MKAGLWLALGFLTRVPVPAVAFEPKALAASLFWFPAVGLAIGACVAGTLTAGQVAFGPWGGAFLALVAWVVFTGGLHLDGVADTFDGLSASGSDPARALAVMKDSRVGAHGAVALVGITLGKYVALSQLVTSWSVGQSGAVLLLACLWARLLVGFAMSRVGPVPGSSLGAMFHQAVQPRHVWAGAGWLVVPLSVVLWASPTWATAGIALGSLLAGGVGAWVFLVVCIRRFGGVSGDTHGALIELVELVTLFTWGLRA